MLQLFLVLVGGLCAALGGVLSTWYKAKKTCKIRMDEIIAEKKVEACEKALLLMGQLRPLLIEGIPEDWLRFVFKQEEWFWNNRAYLPKEFSNNWLTIKLELRKAIRMEKAIYKQTVTDENKADDLVDLESHIRQLAKEAEERIEREFHLQPIKIHRLKKQLKG